MGSRSADYADFSAEDRLSPSKKDTKAGPPQIEFTGQS